MSNILELSDVEVEIGEAYILQGVSFSVPSGEIVALLGRNGAGKTTTLESILGFYPPRSGDIIFKGESILNNSPYEIARMGISYSPDSARIFPTLTVKENLRMGMLQNESTEKLKGIYDLFPFLQEHATNTGKSLSGGEQKLLALARAMISQAHDLLLVDEPTEGLSPENAQKTFAALEEIKKRASILLVADNLDMAKDFAERFVMMSNGKVVERGLMPELMDKPELVEKYLGTAV